MSFADFPEDEEDWTREQLLDCGRQMAIDAVLSKASFIKGISLTYDSRHGYWNFDPEQTKVLAEGMRDFIHHPMRARRRLRGLQ